MENQRNVESEARATIICEDAGLERPCRPDDFPSQRPAPQVRVEVPVPWEPTNSILGSAGIDRLYGTDGNDVMFGGAGSDMLAGGEGNDLLIGGADGSTLFGQGGSDLFVFGGGRNWFMDFDADGGDRIGGLTRANLDEARTLQVGEHMAVFWGTSPHMSTSDGGDPQVIWLANTLVADFNEDVAAGRVFHVTPPPTPPGGEADALL